MLAQRMQIHTADLSNSNVFDTGSVQHAFDAYLLAEDILDVAISSGWTSFPNTSGQLMRIGQIMYILCGSRPTSENQVLSGHMMAVIKAAA